MIEHLDADLLVIQECEDPSQSDADFLEWSGSYLWRGPIKSKGIGVFAPKGATLTPQAWTETGHAEFLPFRYGDDLTVLGVWTQQGDRSAESYIAQFWHYLAANRSHVQERTLICGDFNSNSIWDRPRSIWNHSDCVRELEALGMVSLYHAQMAEQHGAETVPTFFQNRNSAKPFHIDYVFANQALVLTGQITLSIEPPEVWLPHSDHLPMIIDFSD